ncbi:MAG: pyridoxamine 5'-phosphate oxidase family protein [Hyphomicrobiaceae bacterium]|nr:pyridoxamine 5'-phosphate oxidase family protein [Hyphomicrobiaceae bacterium]
MGMDHRIATLEALERHYAAPRPQSLVKEVGRLTAEYRAWIAASPFVVLASVGDGGLDCSPRGDDPGFVQVLDETTLLLPDWPGNNRIDTLRNIVVDPRVALLFLVPGRSESIRVVGRAIISADPALLDRCASHAKRPVTVLVITIASVYFQCARAAIRSRLWDGAESGKSLPLPSIGEILQAIAADGEFDGKAYDAELGERVNRSLY